MVTAGHYSLKEIPNEEEWTKDLEKVSLMCNSIHDIPLGMSPNCPKLSTLLLQNNLSLKFLPNPFFSRMHALCTLDLSGTNIMELPNSLSDLESLKALLLGECGKLVYVPCLGKLKALIELDLSNSAIEEVPQGMENLLNLKYLSMNGANYLKMLPTSLLLNFPNLQLFLLPYQIQTSAEEIVRLKQLEEFEGPVKNVRDFGHFVRTRQSRVHNTFYSIQVQPTYDRFSRRRNQVVLHRCDPEKIEERYVTMSSAQDILIFHQCEGLSKCLTDDFSQVEDPRSLKMLRISNSKGIECILTYDQFMAPEKLEFQFSSLEKILLRELPDFMGVIHKMEIEAAVFASPPPPHPQSVFSCLKYLTICKCNKMEKLGLPVSGFPNLEKICVQWCDEIEEIIEIADDNGRGEEEREAPFVSLPKLKELYLIQLPRLSNICKATMICISMDTIHLKECRALKKLPLSSIPATPISSNPSFDFGTNEDNLFDQSFKRMTVFVNFF